MAAGLVVFYPALVCDGLSLTAAADDDAEDAEDAEDMGGGGLIIGLEGYFEAWWCRFGAQWIGCVCCDNRVGEGVFRSACCQKRLFGVACRREGQRRP